MGMGLLMLNQRTQIIKVPLSAELGRFLLSYPAMFFPTPVKLYPGSQAIRELVFTQF